MKRITTLFFCLLASIAVHLNAQTTFTGSKGAIGITYSGLGYNYANYLKVMDGGGSYDNKGYFSLGITYIHPVTQSLDIEVGVNYNNYTYEFDNPSLGPGVLEPFEVKNEVIDIPITVRWNFHKFFFLNGGLSVGIDTGKYDHLDSQTGIGAMIGVGAKYDLKNSPIGFFVNPYYKMHSLIPFLKDKNHVRAAEAGFRLGIVYNL